MRISRIGEWQLHDRKALRLRILHNISACISRLPPVQTLLHGTGIVQSFRSCKAPFSYEISRI